MEVYPARCRNLSGKPQANLATSRAELDKLSPFSCTNPIILYLYCYSIFSHRFSMGTFKIFII